MFLSPIVHGEHYTCEIAPPNSLIAPAVTVDRAKQTRYSVITSSNCLQSRYFDCDFEKDGYQGTDGGLGAGTPMFISEVMHGTACSLL